MMCLFFNPCLFRTIFHKENFSKCGVQWQFTLWYDCICSIQIHARFLFVEHLFEKCVPSRSSAHGAAPSSGVSLEFKVAALNLIGIGVLLALEIFGVISALEISGNAFPFSPVFCPDATERLAQGHCRLKITRVGCGSFDEGSFSEFIFKIGIRNMPGACGFNHAWVWWRDPNQMASHCCLNSANGSHVIPDIRYK